jgi:hypothetical protein
MSIKSSDDKMDKFPLDENFIDHSGKSRRFHISIVETIADGYFLEAKEITKDEGYRFETYSSISPFTALGKMRKKIHRKLSTRYIYTHENGQIALTHDEIYGRISYNGIVIDGKLVEFEHFLELLTTYEGFNLSIKIDDPSE